MLDQGRGASPSQIPCPKCGGRRCAVTDSRGTREDRIRRRRCCLDCATRWTTFEVSAADLERVERLAEMVATLTSARDDLSRMIEALRRDIADG
jgi:transcriptional regulator NrdR family protein